MGAAHNGEPVHERREHGLREVDGVVLHSDVAARRAHTGTDVREVSAAHPGGKRDCARYAESTTLIYCGGLLGRSRWRAHGDRPRTGGCRAFRLAVPAIHAQIGRASCRGRALISELAGSLTTVRGPSPGARHMYLPTKPP